MPKASPSRELQEQFETNRRDWVNRVERLVDQISQWAKAENWTFERREKPITEHLLGTYGLPELVIHVPGGQLVVNPIGLHVAGGNGRVDLEAIPTLSRVRLLAAPDEWQIWTDSNVPLRVTWNRESFVQLARDLLN
jgi:hypothetical protein